jgi:tRNA threonylcarbamoyladenosine biosynthesis protein TsaB
MLVLALDTALNACSVALVESGGGRESVRAVESERRERGHAEALLPMVERVMGQGGARFGEIDRFAVTIGPGSFTGLRVALSAARSFALANGKPAIGVGTLAALAAAAFGDDQEPVAAVIDARRDEAYWQLFALPGRPITPAMLAPYHEIARSIDSPKVRLVGSGAVRLAQEDPGRLHMVSDAVTPDILWIARLGAKADPDTAPAKPAYIRPPDAKPQRERAIANRENSESPWFPRSSS